MTPGRCQSVTPTNFVFGRGRIEGRSRRPWRVTTSRCVVAPPTRRIIEKQVAAEQMAHELRMPMVRLVEGSGGGGSVKSLESARLHLRAIPAGLGAHGAQPRDGASREPGPRSDRRFRRRESRAEPLFAARARSVADVRRRSAGRRCGRPEDDQGRARQQPDPRRERRDRRRSRQRARSVRAHAAFPSVSALLGLRACRRGRRSDGRSRAP